MAELGGERSWWPTIILLSWLVAKFRSLEKQTPHEQSCHTSWHLKFDCKSVWLMNPSAEDPTDYINSDAIKINPNSFLLPFSLSFETRRFAESVVRSVALWLESVFSEFLLARARPPRLSILFRSWRICTRYVNLSATRFSVECPLDIFFAFSPPECQNFEKPGLKEARGVNGICM